MIITELLDLGMQCKDILTGIDDRTTGVDEFKDSLTMLAKKIEEEASWKEKALSAETKISALEKKIAALDERNVMLIRENATLRSDVHGLVEALKQVAAKNPLRRTSLAKSFVEVWDTRENDVRVMWCDQCHFEETRNIIESRVPKPDVSREEVIHAFCCLYKEMMKADTDDERAYCLDEWKSSFNIYSELDHT